MAVLLICIVGLLIVAASSFLVTGIVSKTAISDRAATAIVELAMGAQIQAFQSFRTSYPRNWPTAGELASAMSSSSIPASKNLARAPTGLAWALYVDPAGVKFCLLPVSVGRDPANQADASSRTIQKLANRLKRHWTHVQVAPACDQAPVDCEINPDFCDSDEPRVLLHRIPRL